MLKQNAIHTQRKNEMIKSPAHLDNFKASPIKDRFAIVDVTQDAVKGTVYWEVSSGKTKKQAVERFYGRFMFRPVDQEAIQLAQQWNRLKLIKIQANHRTLIEDKLTLIAIM